MPVFFKLKIKEFHMYSISHNQEPLNQLIISTRLTQAQRPRSLSLSLIVLTLSITTALSVIKEPEDFNTETVFSNSRLFFSAKNSCESIRLAHSTETLILK